jgi:hypothetical protein
MLRCPSSTQCMLWQGSHAGVRDAQLIDSILQIAHLPCTYQGPLLISTTDPLWSGNRSRDMAFHSYLHWNNRDPTRQRARLTFLR